MPFRDLPFDDLTPRELYAVLRLRAEVFVVEQECAYLDPDGVDPEARHLLGTEGDRLVAYARWHAGPDGMRISRVVTHAERRGDGLGHALMRECLSRIVERPLRLHAQSHLRGFYETHGFRVAGEEFPEDGIPHVLMIRE